MNGQMLQECTHQRLINNQTSPLFLLDPLFVGTQDFSLRSDVTSFFILNFVEEDHRFNFFFSVALSRNNRSAEI